MLQRIFGRAPALDLRFAQRECVVVPQTPTRVALHADVHFAALSHGVAITIDDAHLVWEWPGAKGRDVFRRSRWDRAVVEGKFRYPPQALAVTVDETAATVTLTFTDPLIPHDAEPPPGESALVLELSLAGAKPMRRELWRVRMQGWDAPVAGEWVGGG